MSETNLEGIEQAECAWCGNYYWSVIDGVRSEFTNCCTYQCNREYKQWAARRAGLMKPLPKPITFESRPGHDVKLYELNGEWKWACTCGAMGQRIPSREKTEGRARVHLRGQWA